MSEFKPSAAAAIARIGVEAMDRPELMGMLYVLDAAPVRKRDGRIITSDAYICPVIVTVDDTLYLVNSQADLDSAPAGLYYELTKYQRAIVVRDIEINQQKRHEKVPVKKVQPSNGWYLERAEVVEVRRNVDALRRRIRQLALSKIETITLQNGTAVTLDEALARLDGLRGKDRPSEWVVQRGGKAYMQPLVDGPALGFNTKPRYTVDPITAPA